MTYIKAEKKAEATRFLNERLAIARKQLKPDSLELGVELAFNGKTLLELSEFADAQGLLQESLLIREQLEPQAWTTFSAKALLGVALLGQKNFAEAEPLMLAGFEGMKQRETTIPPAAKVRIPETIDSLIELYTALGKTESVEKWQVERANYKNN